MKQVYLSEIISEQDKKFIVQSYFKVKSSQLTSKIDKQMNEISKKYLENYYKKILGVSWRDLIEKYNIRKQSLYLISELIESKVESLSNKYFDGGYFTSGLKYYSSEEYPVTVDFRVIDNFSKCKSRKKIVSLLYEKQEIKDNLVSEMLSRGIMTEYSFLPRIDDYEELSVKYPDVFDLWIQNQLQKTDEIEVISVEEEVNKLKIFLGC